jgi:hypothetical protein
VSAPPPLSQHPVDQLIRELIATNRATSPEEVAQIIARMATAAFIDRVKTVPQSKTQIQRVDSLHYHLTKRVVVERQWVFSTTTQDYLADLHRATGQGPNRL